MSEQVKPTRTGMLQRKAQITLAAQGKDLLERKRDALLREFMPLIDETMRLNVRLERATADAQFALAVSEAIDGLISIRSAAMASEGELLVDITGENVMGVALPTVNKAKSAVRSITGRGYSFIGVSGRIDEAAERFERILDIIIESAGIETKLKRLGEELQKTNRRVNALKYVVIPRLQGEVKQIAMVLEERAREDLFRLKKVKKSLEKRRKQMVVSAQEKSAAREVS